MLPVKLLEFNQRLPRLVRLPNTVGMLPARLLLGNSKKVTFPLVQVTPYQEQGVLVSFHPVLSVQLAPFFDDITDALGQTRRCQNGPCSLSAEISV